MNKFLKTIYAAWMLFLLVTSNGFAAPKLVSITVTPASPGITLGFKQQFTAVGTYSNKTTEDITATVTWTSAQTNIATIDSQGLATSVSVGTTSIQASLGSVSGSITLTVTPATLTSINITPTDPNVTLGRTRQFAATGTYSDNSTKDVTASVTWISSQLTVATVDSQGLATSASVGTTSIQASLGGVAASTTLTVTPATLTSLSIAPAEPSIALGETRQFSATGTYTDGSVRDVTSSVTWASQNGAVATINSRGATVSIGAGTTVITAALESILATTTMTVRDVLRESPFGFHPASVAKQGYTGNGFGDAQNIGARWTRQGLYAYWFKIQPVLSSPTYTFAVYDNQWKAVPSGISILANIAPQGPIDEGYCLPGSYLPIDQQKYIAFVKATVERYDGDGIGDMPGLINPIKFWQVGNEPNSAKSGFADLQRITYTAIKEACLDCTVLIGGVPGMPPASTYISNFDQQYKPILDALAGSYVDVMDFHWYGAATGDYLGAKQVYDHIRSVMNADGFAPDLPVWIAEMGAYSGDPVAVGPLGGVDYPSQTERQQALDYFKRFVYPLSFGVKKIFPAFGLMEGFKYDGGYFDYTGLIYDGWDVTGGTPYDLGLGKKKLGYYTYKKMTEMLEGSDWSSIQTIQESGDVHIYRIMKNGKPVYAAWWDYFNDPSYTSGKTIQVDISGLDGTTAIITEVVPKFTTGAQVTDFSSAFNVNYAAFSAGSVSVSLGDSPVIVEASPLSPINMVTLTEDKEGGSARPEIVATGDRVFVTYLGHITGGMTTRSFDVKIYNADLSSVVTFTTIVPPSVEYGGATDIRIAREGQFVYAFYETSTESTTYLHGAKYALNDRFDMVARAPEPIASAKPEFQALDGDEVLNDPAPLVGPDSVFIVTRIRYSLATTGRTLYRVREFSKDNLTRIRQFDLDLSDIADGRGRVTSLLFWNNKIHIALATTVSDRGINEGNDDGAPSDIVLVKMNPDWTFDPQTDARKISAEPYDRENYITGLRADGAGFYLTYKQAIGAPPNGDQRAVIRMFDKNFNPVHKEIVRSVIWGEGGGEIRPSLEISGNRFYSGQSASQGLGTGNAEIYIYEVQ